MKFIENSHFLGKSLFASVRKICQWYDWNIKNGSQTEASDCDNDIDRRWIIAFVFSPQFQNLPCPWFTIVSKIRSLENSEK